MMKKIYFFLFAAMTAASLQAQTLVAYYPFKGNAADSSGNSMNGTAVNVTPAADRFGNPNSAYAFNGVSSSVSIPGAVMQFNSYTYAMWFRISQLPATASGKALISLGNNMGDQFLLLCNTCPVNGGGSPKTGLIGGSYFNSSSPNSYVVSTANADTFAWHHVAYTRDSAAMMIRIYVDGTPAGASAIASANAFYGGSNVLGSIGSRVSGQFFGGNLDEVRIYNYAMTDANVLALYNAEKTMPTGIDKAAANASFRIYPNPSSGSIHIVDAAGMSKVSVFDASGRLVQAYKNPTAAIQLNDVQPGIYFCTFEKDGRVAGTARVLVQ